MFGKKGRFAKVQVGTKGQDSLWIASAIQKLVVAARAVVKDPLRAKGLNEKLSESDSCHLSQLLQIPGINQPLD